MLASIIRYVAPFGEWTSIGYGVRQTMYKTIARLPREQKCKSNIVVSALLYPTMYLHFFCFCIVRDPICFAYLCASTHTYDCPTYNRAVVWVCIRIGKTLYTHFRMYNCKQFQTYAAYFTLHESLKYYNFKVLNTSSYSWTNVGSRLEAVFIGFSSESFCCNLVFSSHIILFLTKVTGRPKMHSCTKTPCFNVNHVCFMQMSGSVLFRVIY